MRCRIYFYFREANKIEPVFPSGNLFHFVHRVLCVLGKLSLDEQTQSCLVMNKCVEGVPGADLCVCPGENECQGELTTLTLDI